MAKFLRLHRLIDRKAVTINPAVISAIEPVPAVEAIAARPAVPASEGAPGKAWPPARPAMPAVAAQVGSPECSILYLTTFSEPLRVMESHDAIEAAINGDTKVQDDRPEMRELRDAEEKARAAAAEKAKVDAMSAEDKARRDNTNIPKSAAQAQAQR